LSVCSQDISKSYERIFIKLSGAKSISALNDSVCDGTDIEQPCTKAAERIELIFNVGKLRDGTSDGFLVTEVPAQSIALVRKQT
jgi:hypothetical protein